MRSLFSLPYCSATVSELHTAFPLLLANLSYVDRDGEMNRDSEITIRSVTGPDGRQITGVYHYSTIT